MEIDTPENIKKYWDGRTNYLIRLFMYALRGLDLFNQWRYLIMTIVAIYYMFKLTNPWFMPIIFLVCVPILCLVGWFQVHRMSKVIDWLSIKFATHFGMYNITLQEEIRDHLKKLASDKK